MTTATAPLTSDQTPRDHRPLVVTIVCALTAFSSAVLFFRELNSGGDGHSGTPMGKIERKNAQVRRKSKDGFIWSNLSSGSPLYGKDYVQTGPGSQALIQLTGTGENTTLELQENSLVIIEEVTDLSLNFLKGRGTIRGPQGESQIEASAEGPAKVTPSAYLPKSPAPLSEFLTSTGNAEVSFDWTAQNEVNGTKLELSQNPRFEKVSTRSMSVKTGTPPKLNLPPGTYFWRLTASDKPVSSVVSFQITALPELSAKAPTGKVDKPSDAKPLQFSWIPVDDGTDGGEAVIEFATDRQFQKVVFSQPVSLQSGAARIEEYKSDAADPVFWRIRGKFKGTEISSSPLALEWNEAAAPVAASALPAAEPSLATGASDSEPLEPEAEAKPPITTQSSATVTIGEVPVFAWARIPGATGYEVEFSKDKDFTDVIANKNAPSNYVKLKADTEGTIYWRVRGQFGEKNGVWSSTGTFTVVP